MFLTRVSIILLTSSFASSKIYKRCELARELKNLHIPEEEIPTWICIAQHESNFDTGAMNPGSGDHGLFQISQLYWCSPPGDGYGCNTPCSKFRDDDIADDLQCIRRIHNEHRRISGDGFNAWVVYPLHCKVDNSKYIQECLHEESSSSPDSSSNVTDNEILTEDVDEYGDGYHFPALPDFSKVHDIEKDNDYRDGYEFPKLPYSKTSIYESVPVKNASEPSSNSTSRNQVILKLQFSSPSIHISDSEGEKSPKLPYSKESILFSISAVEKNYDFPKFPTSKQSIHHFITSDSEKQLTPDEFPSQNPNSDLSSSAVTTTKDQIYYDSATILTADLSSPTTYSYSESPTTILNDVESVTRQYTPTTETPLTSQEFVLSARKLILQSPSMHHNTHLDTSTAKFEGIFNSFTTKSLINPLVSMPPNTDTFLMNNNQVLNKSLMQISSSNKSPMATSNPPISLMSKLLNTVSSDNYKVQKNINTSILSSLLASEHENQASTAKHLIFSDYDAASSTSPPYSFPLTTSKPYAEPASSTKDFISERSGFDPFKTTTTKKYIFSYSFSSRRNVTGLIPTISSRNLSQTSTAKPGIYTTTTYSFKPLTTLYARRIPDTTLKPSGKQVTFAPGSFFSWIFNSQTLPPLVRPPRPPGDRPGGRPTTARPGLGVRPSGFPRPGVSHSPLQPDLGSITTRRPLPMRPNMMFRPPRPQRKPFAPSRPLTNLPRRPFRSDVANNSEIYNFNGTEQVNKHEITSVVYGLRDKNITAVVTEKTIAASSFGRSGKSQNDKESKFEIKLDDHFVYLRTKYGYRLFRT